MGQRAATKLEAHVLFLHCCKKPHMQIARETGLVVSLVKDVIKRYYGIRKTKDDHGNRD